MPDFRVFCQPTSTEPTEIQLSADESHHLVSVNRARRGDTVVAFDGRGREWIGELVRDDRRAATLAVRFHQQAKPLPYSITLGQALPKGPTMDAIVRKATELGVAAIVPLESERTLVSSLLAATPAGGEEEAWSTIVQGLFASLDFRYLE